MVTTLSAIAKIAGLKKTLRCLGSAAGKISFIAGYLKLPVMIRDTQKRHSEKLENE